MFHLTKKQNNLLNFIAEQIKLNGISPTISEIMKEFNLKSPATVHQHIEVLIKKRYLVKDENSTRSLRLAEDESVNIPIIGIIAAGSPIEALENDLETISVGTEFTNDRGNHYALRVKGDSMIDDGIYDGDIVIIKKQVTAENGQTVVAIIDEGEATLKKIFKEKKGFRLQPANQNLLPLYRDEVEVRGVVIKVIRDMNNKSIIKITEDNGLKTIDLFAGVGGIRKGFENAGFQTVFSNDFEPKCKDTYDLNFDTCKLIVEDIRQIGIEDLPDFDFLLGGFPCQAFSVAGYRQGFDDKKGRGNLFFDVAKIIEERKPKGFLLENVKNLYGHDKGRTFKIIKETLEGLGYHVHAKVLNTMEYGNIPQNRERVYIVGFKDKKHYDLFKYPEKQKLTVSILDILEKERVDNKYYYNDKPLYEKLKNDVTEEGKVYQWRRKYVRANKSGVCPTLTANMGTGGHNVPIIKDKYGIRKLTPKECARIQGFPSDFKIPKNISDSHLYKQFGNSVSVPVIEAVAKQMAKVL